jgi:hypothetical protein
MIYYSPMANTTITAKPATLGYTQEVEIQRLSDLLCGAFEGGSNYWYRIDEFVKPENFDNSEEGDEKFRHLSYPCNKGGALIISDINEEDDEEKETWTLNLESMAKGLKVMAKDYPRHMENFLAGNDDAETSDVYLQCCLFGEVIFG